MTPVLNALGALLAYPTRDLVDALPEIAATLATERNLSDPVRASLDALAAELSRGDLIDLEERYVGLFDRGRATSLHLFEHVHGDSRDRGQAMVDLKAVYERAGFVLAPGELPDYLPAVLEFLSRRPFHEAQEMLADCAHILRALAGALVRHDSRYASVPQALLAVAGLPAVTDSLDEPVVAELSLDDEWREEQVVFGPPGGQRCGAAHPAAPAVIRITPRQV